MNYVKLAMRWVIRLGLLALLALTLGALTVLVAIPRATHGAALTVLTGSMTPTIPVGSTVVERPVDPGTLHVGDIATYQVAPGVNEYITHRIVAINTKTNPVTFTFKGDANRGPDMSPVPAGAIRGKVWFHVPYLGAIKDMFHGGSGRTLLLGALTVGLAGFSIFELLSVVRERRRKAVGADRPDLELDVRTHAFGDVPPSFVAELLQGSCDVVDNTTSRLKFSGSDERLDLLRELLAPYGTPADPETTTRETGREDGAAGEDGDLPAEERRHGLRVVPVEAEHAAPAHA